MIYLLWTDWCDEFDLCGVFSSLQVAQEELRRLNTEKKSQYQTFHIQEFELDKPAIDIWS